MLNQSLNFKAVIVGTDEECNEIRNILCTSDRFKDLGFINPYTSSFLSQIQSSNPNLIINASSDPRIDSFLKKTKGTNSCILSALNAQILFCSIITETDKENIRKFRTRILHGIKEICHTAHLTKEVKESLTLILSVAINSLNADCGSIMLTDPRKRMLNIEMAHGINENIINTTRQKIGKGIAGRVAHTGIPLLLNGKNESEFATGNDRRDVVSSISVPLIINNQTIGVLNLSSKNISKVFNLDDLNYASDLAHFAAGVIDSSREYQKNKQTSAIYSLLSSASDILNLNYPLQERLNLLMMKIVNSLNGQICNLYNFDKESNTFYVQASSYYDLNRRYTQMIRLNDFFTGRMLRCREQFTFSLPQKKISLHKCFIAQPLFSNKEISGLLLFQFHTNQNNLENEKKLLEKVAGYLEHEFSQLSLLEGTRLNLIRYSAFSEIVSDLSLIHNIRSIAKMIVVNTCLLFETENCILRLYNEIMNCFEELESFSLKGRAHLEDLKSLDNSIAIQIMNNINPVLINDLSKVSFLNSDVPCKSVISICLRHNGRIMGTLSVYDKSKFSVHDQNNFTSHDRELFRDYSVQVIRMLNRFLCF